ncbi:N-terminal methyltransferase [Rhynchophorus ferrugineus]|uniref:N-terminal methyltransferase n=1 Tax=Rhynchophorus ferrugineus TaxID=354439 RepID=UPI003FCD3568
METEISFPYGDNFYNNAANYWSEIPPTVDGMLGGFGYISDTDIRSSRMLLKQIFQSKNPPGREYALDCGAGIGRITKFLLANIFKKVDLVEQNPEFLQTAKTYLGSNIMDKKIGQMIPIGLQNFEPEPNKYNLVWIQWVLGHLTDDHLVRFFNICQKSLKQNGIIIVKENVTSLNIVEVDEKDSSVTRPISYFKQLFEKSNLDCLRVVKQINLPPGLYPVYMFVLRPKK